MMEVINYSDKCTEKAGAGAVLTLVFKLRNPQIFA